jgi:hypothetical protein
MSVMRRICSACWITKATHIYSEYIIVTAFRRQKWLLENTSRSRYNLLPFFFNFTYTDIVRHSVTQWLYYCHCVRVPLNVYIIPAASEISVTLVASLDYAILVHSTHWSIHQTATSNHMQKYFTLSDFNSNAEYVQSFAHLCKYIYYHQLCTSWNTEWVL